MENKAKQIVSKKDFWFGVVIIAFSTALLLSTGFESEDYFLLPRIVYFGMLAMGILLIVTTVLKKSDNDIKTAKPNFYEIVTPILAFLCVSLVKLLGFYTSMTLFSLVLTFLLVKEYSKRSIITGIAYSLLVNVVMYSIFTVLFRIMTPTGLFI